MNDALAALTHELQFARAWVAYRSEVDDHRKAGRPIPDSLSQASLLLHAFASGTVPLQGCMDLLQQATATAYRHLYSELRIALVSSCTAQGADPQHAVSSVRSLESSVPPWEALAALSADPRFGQAIARSAELSRIKDDMEVLKFFSVLRPAAPSGGAGGAASDPEAPTTSVVAAAAAAARCGAGAGPGDRDSAAEVEVEVEGSSGGVGGAQREGGRGDRDETRAGEAGRRRDPSGAQPGPPSAKKRRRGARSTQGEENEVEMVWDLDEMEEEGPGPSGSGAGAARAAAARALAGQGGGARADAAEENVQEISDASGSDHPRPPSDPPPEPPQDPAPDSNPSNPYVKPYYDFNSALYANQGTAGGAAGANAPPYNPFGFTQPPGDPGPGLGGFGGTMNMNLDPASAAAAAAAGPAAAYNPFLFPGQGPWEGLAAAPMNMMLNMGMMVPVNPFMAPHAPHAPHPGIWDAAGGQGGQGEDRLALPPAPPPFPDQAFQPPLAPHAPHAPHAPPRRGPELDHLCGSPPLAKDGTVLFAVAGNYFSKWDVPSGWFSEFSLEEGAAICAALSDIGISAEVKGVIARPPVQWFDWGREQEERVLYLRALGLREGEGAYSKEMARRGKNREGTGRRALIWTSAESAAEILSIDSMRKLQQRGLELWVPRLTTWQDGGPGCSTPTYLEALVSESLSRCNMDARDWAGSERRLRDLDLIRSAAFGGGVGGNSRRWLLEFARDTRPSNNRTTRIPAFLSALLPHMGTAGVAAITAAALGMREVEGSGGGGGGPAPPPPPPPPPPPRTTPPPPPPAGGEGGGGCAAAAAAPSAASPRGKGKGPPAPPSAQFRQVLYLWFAAEAPLVSICEAWEAGRVRPHHGAGSAAPGPDSGSAAARPGPGGGARGAAAAPGQPGQPGKLGQAQRQYEGYSLRVLNGEEDTGPGQLPSYGYMTWLARRGFLGAVTRAGGGFVKSYFGGVDGIAKITSLAFSPNCLKLAASTQDRVVYLFNDDGEVKDKFKTKPALPETGTGYTVRSMAFSPDSSKLAIAQSDAIVFVYRLGMEWGEKKSICNKFQVSSPVTTVAWPTASPNHIFFGCADGRVYVGNLRTNKADVAVRHPEGSHVASLTPSQEGTWLLSGHMDGSVLRFPAQEVTQAEAVVRHDCPPYALGWGKAIIVAGTDCKVSFYNLKGGMIKQFSFMDEGGGREFTACCVSPSGDAVVLGSYDKLIIFKHQSSTNQWEQAAVKEIRNLYTVTSLAWSPDGSKVAVGSLTGRLDTYDACERRVRYRGRFELVYVSKAQVLVTTLATGQRVPVRSQFGLDLEKVDIHKDRYLVVRTSKTLLLGDLHTGRLSEVEWGAKGGGGEKFLFYEENVGLIHHAGELSILEYGRSEVLATCRTEHTSRHLLSVRVAEARGRGGEEVRRLACLVDLQTARVLDLLSGLTLASISHDCRIDWLELNAKGTHLLFRDKKHRLHLYDIAAQDRTTLLTTCGYVQWVPNSDVVVAQSRATMVVWYSIHAPDKQKVFPIRGDIYDIERVPGRTEVLVQEDVQTVSYALDENMIALDSALEAGELQYAAQILGPQPLTVETEARWLQLAERSLDALDLAVAEQCFAAIGNISRAKYVRSLIDLSEKMRLQEKARGADNPRGVDTPPVLARLAVLRKQWHVAEGLMLQQGLTDEVIKMYQEIHRWEDVLRVAKRANHPDYPSLKSKYFDWLVSTQQFDKAGALREAEGKTNDAIGLFLQGGFPSLAARVVLKHQERSFEPEILASISAALVKAGLHEPLGEFFEGLGRHDEALDSFRKGKSYRRCTELASKYNPGLVVQLEEEWGDWLASQKQFDVAANHYIDAGRVGKAIEAAMEARQWTKAAQLAESQRREVSEPVFARIAEKFRQAGSWEEAERMYVKAGRAQEAVEMHLDAGRYDPAHKVAMGHMSDSAIEVLYGGRARELEAQHRSREAERLYVLSGKHDSAIHMYKRLRMYDQMLRLVGQHRKDLLLESHLSVAQQLEKEMRFKDAERHYVEARDWKTAVHMYRGQAMWDDAIRVAKSYGGANAAKQVAYARAVALGPQEGSAYLAKTGLVEQAVAFAIESGAFNLAFEYTKQHQPQKVAEVHLKYAMFLEDEGKFAEAEAEFIKAGKPREAIDMYLHQQDWGAARRVAEMADPDSVPEILCGQASALAASKDYPQAEGLYLAAKRPDLALRMYKDARLLEKALAVAQDYLPGKAQEIRSEIQQARGAAAGAGGSGAGRVGEVISQARAMERGQNYHGAIQLYLSLSRDHTEDISVLEEAWERAVALAQGYARERAPEVVAAAADRLVGVGRPDAAAELYQGIQDLMGEVGVYVRAGQWDRARERAKPSPPAQSWVEDQFRLGQLKQGIEASAQGGGGGETEQSVQQRLDYHFLKGETEQAQAYLVKDLATRLRQGDLGGAAASLAKYGPPVRQDVLDPYRSLAKEILALPADKRDSEAEANLARVLGRVVGGLEGMPSVGQNVVQEFKALHQAAHFLSLSPRSLKAGLKELAARQATSLLRYVRHIPADKAFYEAGMAWRGLGGKRDNMAFVCLNKFLDIQEAMEESKAPGATVTLENADLLTTDIPVDFPLPAKGYVPDHKVEEVREWILTISMKSDVEQTLSERRCGACHNGTYEASLVCHVCKNKSQMCWASGYPLSDRVACTADSRHEAERARWNEWVEKAEKCPVCETSQRCFY